MRLCCALESEKRRLTLFDVAVLVDCGTEAVLVSSAAVGTDDDIDSTSAMARRLDGASEWRSAEAGGG